MLRASLYWRPGNRLSAHLSWEWHSALCWLGKSRSNHLKNPASFNSNFGWFEVDENTLRFLPVEILLFLRHLLYNFNRFNTDVTNTLYQINDLFFVISKFVAVEMLSNCRILGRFFYWSKTHSTALRLPSLYSQTVAGIPVNIVCESMMTAPASLSARRQKPTSETNRSCCLFSVRRFRLLI